MARLFCRPIAAARSHCEALEPLPRNGLQFAPVKYFFEQDAEIQLIASPAVACGPERVQPVFVAKLPVLLLKILFWTLACCGTSL
jgi:hypothetical protein